MESMQMKQVEHIISERGSVWHYRSPRLYFIWVLFFTTCSQLEGDGRRVLMCPPHLKLQLCRAAIGSISCPWGRNSCAMFLRNYRTIASIALGLGVTIYLPPQRSLLYQECGGFYKEGTPASGELSINIPLQRSNSLN